MLGKENFSETNKNEYNDSLPKENETVIIPIIQETATVDKHVVEKGKIRIEKGIEETNETVDVSLQHDEYTIRRVAINQYVDGDAPQVRHEGDTLIIPVVKEVVVKRLLLVEEVRITKEIVSTTEQFEMPLRKEVVTITRSTDKDGPSVQS